MATSMTTKPRALHKRLRDYPEECFRHSFDRLPAQTPVELVAADDQDHGASSALELVPRRTPSRSPLAPAAYSTVCQCGYPQCPSDLRADLMGCYSSYAEVMPPISTIQQEYSIQEAQEDTYLAGASREIEPGSDTYSPGVFIAFQADGNVPLQALLSFPGREDNNPYDPSDFTSSPGQGTSLSGFEVLPSTLSSPGETMQYGYDSPINWTDAKAASSSSNNPEDMRYRGVLEYPELGSCWYSGNAN